MKRYNIDVNEFIVHLKKAGVTVTEGTGRFFENGVEIDLVQCFLDLPNMAAIDLSVPSKQIELDYGMALRPQTDYPIRPSSDLLVA